MRSALLSLAVCASTALATQGFNYGAVKIDGSFMFQSDFESEFSTAKALSGTKGAFSSARLYTTIQAGSTNDPISAIPAAISEGTTLLLGMWASSGQTTIDNEIAALKSAIKTYGSKFTSLVTGLSVGSEDLYRITPTGLANDPNSVGAGPDVLVSYIKQVRDAVKGTDLEGMKIGHVDTWTGWVNGSNSAVVDAVDWLGMNTFPYFQTTDPNSIENGQSLFQAAYDATAGAGKGKPVWVTETGWPVGGKKSGNAEASVANAKTYWDAVGCGLFGKTNTWWYTLVDANTDPTQPEFGIVGTTLSSKPLYDLSCDGFPLKAASTSKVSEAITPSESPSPLPAPLPTSEAPPMASAITSSSNTPSPQDTTPSSTSTSEPDSPSSSSSEDLSATLTLIDTPSSQATATSSGSGSESTGSGSGSGSSGSSSSGTSSAGPSVVTSTFTASPSNSGSGTGSSDAATTSGSGSSSSTAASSSASSTPNAALAMAPASVGGLVGMIAAVLALF